MTELFTYLDSKTGYTIRQYTKGSGRNSKLYFTTENFTTDDRFSFSAAIRARMGCRTVNYIRPKYPRAR